MYMVAESMSIYVYCCRIYVYSKKKSKNNITNTGGTTTKNFGVTLFKKNKNKNLHFFSKYNYYRNHQNLFDFFKFRSFEFYYILSLFHLK